MLTNLTGLTATHMLAVDPADTAAATSAYIDVRGYEGQVFVSIHNGIIGAGGSVAYTFLTATNSQAANEAAVTPLNGAMTTATESNEPLAQFAVFDASQLKGFLKVVGTVTTDSGPTTYTFYGRKKYA